MSVARSKSASTLPDVRELFYRRTLNDIQTVYSPALRRQAEAQLGIRLPESYIALLKKRNGGRLRMNAVKLRGRSRKAYGPVYTFERIAGLDPDHHESITALTETARGGWAVPEGLFPLDGDGHWWLCLDYRRCGPEGEPVVTHIDTEYESETRVADSFQDLLSGLFFDAGDFVFAIDDRDLVGERLHRELVALGCKGKHPPGASKQERKKTPHMWDWPEYQVEPGGLGSVGPEKAQPASMFVFENGSIDPWTLARPAKHPLLFLHAGLRDQERCVRRLVETFGDAIELIHQPAERPPIRGLPPPGPKRRPAAKRTPPQPVKLDPKDFNSAILAGDLTLIKALLKGGARPDKPYLGRGTVTALDLAIGRGQTGLLKLLLKYARRPLPPSLFSGAVYTGSVREAKLLLGLGLKPNVKELTRYLTHAVTRRDVPVVRLLLSLGARPSREAIRLAAGIVDPWVEIAGFDKKPNRPILRMFKKAGVKPPDAETQRLFDAL